MRPILLPLIGHLRLLVLAGVPVLSLGSLVLAGNLEDGLQAYSAKDYETALQLLRPLAEAGNADAQLQLSFMFEFGHGVETNDAESLRWLRLAADQDQAEAQYWLASTYQFGRGYSDDRIEPDVVKALKWYRAAAENGHVVAGLTLGKSYRLGTLTERDYAQAADWYRLAATHAEDRPKASWEGETLFWSALKVASIYHHDLNVPDRYRLAYQWYEIALLARHDETRIDSPFGPRRQRARVAANLSPAEIARAEEDARAWIAGRNRRETAP